MYGLMNFMIMFVVFILNIYMLMMIVYGVLVLVSASPENPIVKFLEKITMTPSRFFSNKFPALIVKTQTGFLDLSPFVWFVIVLFISFALPAFMSAIFYNSMGW